jgi:hypothetical protein
MTWQASAEGRGRQEHPGNRHTPHQCGAFIRPFALSLPRNFFLARCLHQVLRAVQDWAHRVGEPVCHDCRGCRLLDEARGSAARLPNLMNECGATRLSVRNYQCPIAVYQGVLQSQAGLADSFPTGEGG